MTRGPSELEKAAGKVARAWSAGHETETGMPAVIKAELKSSWPELYRAIEYLRQRVLDRLLQGDDL